MPRRTAAQAEQTRRDVLAAAQQIAAQSGCDSLTLEEAAARAQVTRGAVYHHFGNKTGLCTALVIAELQRMGERISAAASLASGTRDGIRCGCHVFLRESQDVAYQQIVLTDGPGVLGASEWRRLDDRFTTSSLAEAFVALKAEGHPAPDNPQAAAVALSGAMNELSRWVADGNSMDEAGRMLDRLIDAILDPARD